MLFCGILEQSQADRRMEQNDLVCLTYFCFWLCRVIPVPSAPPENVSAEAVSSTQILLTWTAVPESEQNGLILGYKVWSWSLVLTKSFTYITWIYFCIYYSQVSWRRSGKCVVFERDD